jgi:hypothetical protein
MGYLIIFIVGIGCGYFIRELVSRRRRASERKRRYSSEVDAGTSPEDRRLQPLTAKEIPTARGSI